MRSFVKTLILERQRLFDQYESLSEVRSNGTGSEKGSEQSKAGVKPLQDQYQTCEKSNRPGELQKGCLAVKQNPY